MARKTFKKISKVDKMRTDTQTLDIILELKDTQYWTALKKVMKNYIDNRMVVAYNLDEKNPNFAVLHAKESAQALAFKFLIKFVEEEVRRLSQDA